METTELFYKRYIDGHTQFCYLLSLFVHRMANSDHHNAFLSKIQDAMTHRATQQQAGSQTLLEMYNKLPQDHEVRQPIVDMIGPDFPHLKCMAEKHTPAVVSIYGGHSPPPVLSEIDASLFWKLFKQEIAKRVILSMKQRGVEYTTTENENGINGVQPTDQAPTPEHPVVRFYRPNDVIEQITQQVVQEPLLFVYGIRGCTPDVHTTLHDIITDFFATYSRMGAHAPICLPVDVAYVNYELKRPAGLEGTHVYLTKECFNANEQETHRAIHSLSCLSV